MPAAMAHLLNTKPSTGLRKATAPRRPYKAFSVAFKIRPDDAPGASVGDVLLEVDNFLLKLVVPAIKASYDPKTRRLVRYVGTSNVRDEQGKNFDVRIEFGPTRLVQR